MTLILPRRKLLIGAAASLCAPAILRAQVPMTGAGLGAPSGGGAYTAQGVNFDGASYLARGANLTGVVDGKLGILSSWFKMKAGDGAFQIFIEDFSTGGAGNTLQVVRAGDNTLRFDMNNTAAIFANTISTFTAGMGWANILSAWDLSIPRFQVYITDVSDPLAASPTIVNQNINYSIGLDWGIGARYNGTLGLLSADVADFYLNTAQTLDLSVTANRRKFISAGGAPVNLGTDGSVPTGTAPTIFMSGAVGSWPTNKASGGGFTVAAGSIAAASTNPP